MRFAGVDVAATKPVAVGVIEEHPAGLVVVHSVHRGATTQKLVGAQRLAVIQTGLAAMDLPSLTSVMVEIPHSKGVLLDQVAGIAMAVLQIGSPDAIVMDMNVGQWRKALYGRSAPTDEAKRQAFQLAYEELGYIGTDDDVAEALCLALLARKLYRQKFPLT